MIAFKRKFKEFSEYFNLIGEEEKALLQDELIKMKNVKVDYYRNTNSNDLQMWDKIRAQEDLKLIPKIIYFAESLPTTSAGVDQSFSLVKLIKSDIRNRLQETTLEGLIFVAQEYSETQIISIDSRIINLAIQLKKDYAIKKVIKKKSPQNQIENPKEINEVIDEKNICFE